MMAKNKGKLIAQIFDITGSKPETIVDGKTLIDKLSDLSYEHLEKLLKVCKSI